MIMLISLVFFLFLFFSKLKQRHFNDFPSPPGHFFFGNLLEIKYASNLLTALTKFTKDYGSIVTLKVGPFQRALLTTDPKFTNFILTSEGVKKTPNYQNLQPWIGNALLISEGEEWKRNRKLLTSAFHIDLLKNFVAVFESAGDVLITKLELFDDKDLDVCPLMTLCALDIISETTMGVKIHAQEGKCSLYSSSAKEMCRIVLERSMSLRKLKTWSFRFTEDFSRQEKVVKILQDFTSSIIAVRKQIRKKGGKLTLLDLLHDFQAVDGETWNDRRIREEVDTFLFAGHDTTASSLSFTLYLLANHPEIQDKIVQEQTDLFGGEKNPTVTYHDLQKMTYLESVIKESLRLYPPVPLIGKLTTKDLEFENKLIGRHSKVGLFIYGLHRNPDYFPEPEKFDPERFNSADSISFFAFSGGARNCIGKKFALLEMKSVIGKVLRHFELRPAFPRHELDLSAELVLKSKNGVKIGLKRREN